jgi:hypothetical protein
MLHGKLGWGSILLQCIGSRNEVYLLLTASMGKVIPVPIYEPCKRMGGGGGIAACILLYPQAEVSGQCHAPTALTHRELVLVPIGWEVG